MSHQKFDETCTPCIGTAVRNMAAWNNKMPPGPGSLIVTAQVEVPNPGVEPMLVVAVPQGINPAILILDLYMCQKPGIWPQVVCEKPVRHDQGINPLYTQVDIRCGGDIVGSADIFDAH